MTQLQNDEVRHSRFGHSFVIRFSSLVIGNLVLLAFFGLVVTTRAQSFEGQYYCGRGDTEYLRLLDISRRMFAPDPQYQNISMLYTTNWNGFVEGETWAAWWIQNSYGTTYSALPFLHEPYVTFLQNAQDLWFDQMGDGKRSYDKRNGPTVAPNGCLCDAAMPGREIYWQGDGRIDIHDWAIEFTAAGVVMQGELLLISRDTNAISRYLPKLERSVNFIETRRGTNNLFLAGPAGNLLAPSYAGWKKADGTYDKAYLAGLSVNYIAALDRVIELEKLSDNSQKAKLYTKRRTTAKDALHQLTTSEGYLIRSLDPDGVKHGVYGAKEHGYFETSPNQDAVAFHVVDDAQSAKIYNKIASIPQLRPHQFILPNYPAYDDMYEKQEGIWSYGTWINGGHWSTCEARMMLAYYRLGKFDDTRRSMQQLLTFADNFRLDNPLTKCGSDVYQPTLPINLCYDSFGPPAAMVRGLFEYLYKADELILIPHIPPTITKLQQNFPIRFGTKRLFLRTHGTGPMTSVRVNDRKWKKLTRDSIHLPYDQLADANQIEIIFGNDVTNSDPCPLPTIRHDIDPSRTSGNPLIARETRVLDFCTRMDLAGFHNNYERTHAALVRDTIDVVFERQTKIASGEIKKLSAEASQKAADKSYIDAANRLYDGLDNLLRTYKSSAEPTKKKIAALWN
ncbi:MAG: hypothetical protein JWO95_2052 [Verrucomicrobiales bacterium]|nr:hypothetical protein [Verrucomicrobiales bacterium]